MSIILDARLTVLFYDSPSLEKKAIFFRRAIVAYTPELRRQLLTSSVIVVPGVAGKWVGQFSTESPERFAVAAEVEVLTKAQRVVLAEQGWVRED